MTKKKSAPELHEWLCTGTITLSNVTFFITAATEEEARQKAIDGDYHDSEDNVASLDDCTLDPDTVELNE